MSATTTPPVPSVPINENTTQGTAAAASGAAAAIVTIVVWILGMFHLEVPPEVAAALMVLVSAGIHLGGVKLITPTAPTAPPPPP